MSAYVYILECADGRRYYGLANDRRVKGKLLVNGSTRGGEAVIESCAG